MTVSWSILKAYGWSPVTISFGFALLGNALHCFVSSIPTWADVLPSLYHIPIVIAGINLGTRAALGVAFVSGASHMLGAAFGCGHPWIRPLAETALFILVGITAAKMAPFHASDCGLQRVLPAAPTTGSLEGSFRSVSVNQIPALGQIVAGLIHRFRTPLSSIEGAVWLLENRHCPEEKREEFVRIIQKESHQLNDALTEVLEFTQPRKPEFRKADLSSILEDVIEKAGPKEHGPYFLFRKETRGSVPPLICDPGQITRMLLNIVMNSIQATPGGGQIVIEVRCEADRVVICIKDHGRGIPAGIRARVFDPFFTTRDNSLGLGLTIARQIAAAHGSYINIDNSTEKGTSVSVGILLKPPLAQRGSSDAYHEHGSHTGG